MILALARPDPKKNITTLVKAFGECRPLRELANLVSFLGTSPAQCISTSFYVQFRCFITLADINNGKPR